MKPSIPVHDPRFAYIPARAHETVQGLQAFAERQQQRRLAAQTTNVKLIRRKA